VTLGESSGYDLARCAQRNADLILAPAKSRIYAVLPRLEERGYVLRRDVAQSRRPDKQLYRLTASGRAALDAWLNETGEPTTLDQLLLKLFFGEHADPAALIEQVRAFRERKEEEKAVLEGHAESNRSDPGGFFRNLTVTCGLEPAEASIRWAEAAETTLARSAP
jgi:DNA-binding PadR family transcriptional regulator